MKSNRKTPVPDIVTILNRVVAARKAHIMNDLQRKALTALAERYNVEINDDNFKPSFDLPTGYVAGWVGPIYVGVSPEGRISS